MKKRIAIYPGTFDPLTVGHQDIITRACRLCDELYVLVAAGHHKQTLFNLEERNHMVKKILQEMRLPITIHSKPFSGLLIDACHEVDAKIIIRGLRAVSDFEYEMQLAAMNRHLDGLIETVYLMTAENLSFISSTMVKEVAKLNGNIDRLVHPYIKKQLKKRVCH